jgi:hypothetical protein
LRFVDWKKIVVVDGHHERGGDLTLQKRKETRFKKKRKAWSQKEKKHGPKRKETWSQKEKKHGPNKAAW